MQPLIYQNWDLFSQSTNEPANCGIIRIISCFRSKLTYGNINEYSLIGECVHVWPRPHSFSCN